MCPVPGDVKKQLYLFDVCTGCAYNVFMIKSFADKETEKVYHQEFSKRLPQDIQRIALRKLIMIDNAETLDDLRVPPANHLEALKGDRQGQHSIRINGQYRICFVFSESGIGQVQIADYHD